ncbi:MAG: T9SS type A sorting domain-containing protein [Flavobacteriales bacterium]|nr:T9SS type A sorting domain-containing protein [Flavobacteriales bacterium]
MRHLNLKIRKFPFVTVLLVFIISSNCLLAQHNYEFYNDGALIHIQSGAEVHVWGDVHMTKATGVLENYGLIKAQGNSYSDNLFQQSGTGTYLVENSDVNTGERQFIQGSFAVRGGQSQVGVDDGSFYRLELANDQGIVYLVGGGNVVDVRNTVDFNTGTTLNRIITHDIGLTGAITPPANGSLYSSVFGILNTSAGIAMMEDNTSITNGNVSVVDNGYVQGVLRRAINSGGGAYQYIVGLEPAGAGAQRGFQQIELNFGVNTYDVVSCYFESASSNAGTTVTDCSGQSVHYWGGVHHGEWILSDITGSGTGTHTTTVWPQDDNYMGGTTWVVTQNNALAGATNDCGISAVGLSRSGFTSLGEFNVASVLTPLPIELLSINAVGDNNHIDVDWTVVNEVNFSHYELERSEDGVEFEYLITYQGEGVQGNEFIYTHEDYNVKSFQNYYYRLKNVDYDGTYSYSPIVTARIAGGQTVSIYPNPGNEVLNVMLNSDFSGRRSISVINVHGQIIEHHDTSLIEGSSTFSISSRKWAKGLYFIKVQDLNSGEMLSKKWIKQ